MQNQMNVFSDRKSLRNGHSSNQHFTVMKRAIHLPLILLALSILTSSCHKEQAAPIFVSQLSPDQAYLLGLKNDVLFIFQQKDLASGQVSGWFIDKNGAVRGMEGGSEFDEALITTSQIASLKSNAAESQLQLSPEELAPKAHLIESLDEQQLSEPQIDPNAEIEIRVLAVKDNDYDNHPNNCSERQGNATWDEGLANSFEIVLLQAKGSFNQDNEDANAIQILNWLIQIQQTAGF